MLFPTGDKEALVKAMCSQISQGPRPIEKRLEISKLTLLKYGSTASLLQQLYRSILP